VKAFVYRRYGSPEVLRLEDVEKPVPAHDEALIKIHAVSLNRSDWEGLTGKPLYARLGGVLRPRRKILGSDIAGRVEAVGANHTRFEPGDAVFGDILSSLGGFAEYVCVRGGVMAHKPDGLSFEQAAAIPQAAVIALQGTRDQKGVQPGRTVLINGAGGGAGSFAVQLAKSAGAEVTGVDHADKLEFVRSLGADHVIDYTREDFTRGGKKYDLVIDVIAHRSIFACKRALAPYGRYLFVGGSAFTLLQILLLGRSVGRRSGRKVRLLAVKPNREDLILMAERCAAGEIVPVIDRTYRLSEVPDALRYLGEGRAKGKVVISVAREEAG
jgi:NADPH:quinone reductase-like Zn-dependent oxidoreductase